MGFEKSSPPRERSRAFKKRKQAFSSLKRALACGAALMLVAGLGGGMSTARAETIRFATQETGTYAGLPLFDGVPAHLENYLDALMDYAGLDAAVNWANGRRGDFTIPSGPNEGRVVPGSPQWGEGVQGVSTDFPSINAMGQTWNADLVGAIGTVIGDENLYQESWSKSLSAYNATVAAGMQDLRPNPLSGRLDESFGEDETLASTLLSQYSEGIAGTRAEGNEDGFWSKAVLVAKHYTGYAAQWFRTPGNTDISSRALMEYWAEPPLDAIEDGAISGVITSYGRTNGVPNAISPLIADVQGKSPWGGLYTTPDNGAENRLHVDDAYSNGFDRSYTPTWGDAVSLFAVADAGSIAATGASVDRNSELLEGIQNGTYGVTAEDVYRVANTQVAPLVRVGLFNERDASGIPKDYPFADLTAERGTPNNSTTAAHQQVALEAAQESVVLLKNEGGLLPLSKDVDVAVSGPLADTRFRTTYATSTPNVEGAGLTPVGGIEAASTGDVTFASDWQIIRLKSVLDGSYLSVNADGSATLGTGSDAESAATFESFDWGQGAHSYQSTADGRWLQYAAGGVNAAQRVDLGTARTSLPYRLRPVDNGDGTVSFVVGGYSESFNGGFETAYYKQGRYLSVDTTTGALGVTNVLGNAANAEALKTSATRFVVETVKETGADSVSADADYAIVVVGAPARNSSGEGADRSTLALGDEQYSLVENVAKAYPGRTVVVVDSVYPVLVDEIQRNDKVAAIVQSNEGGQFTGLALGKVLYGDYAPTGRLTQTWYASMDALPSLSRYSIPEGQNVLYGLDDLDPRFTVDMSNADPAESKLTYKYTDAETTYDFGYGLSYSSFEYGNLKVGQTDGSFTATVDVTNTGGVATSDVVQLYGSHSDSEYGQAVPKKQLVAFGKVEVAAGQTRTVELAFDSDALAVWDGNAAAHVLESGTYTFQVGASSSDIRGSVSLSVKGQLLAPLNAAEEAINVFDHIFASSDVFYREASKANTAEGLHADALTHGYHVVGARSAGSWTALHDLDLDGAESIAVSLGSTRADAAGVELRLDAPDGPVLAEYVVENTGSDEYMIAASLDSAGDIPVEELSYTTIDKPIDGVEGHHDIYIVFTEADIRVRDLQVTHKATAEPSPTPTSSAGATPTVEPTKTPTPKPTAKPDVSRTAPYTLPGTHNVNGRRWFTTCEEYSQTERCRTEIWATVVVKSGGKFEVRQGWAFNNLTYLPLLTRAQWKGNPLGEAGSWTAADGRLWNTVCDTAATGGNGCRSYRETTVYKATPKAGGGYDFSQSNQWVFNNIVQFAAR